MTPSASPLAAAAPPVKAARHGHLITDPDKILAFVTGGNAIFTVKNTNTGNRATYRVEKSGSDFTVMAFTGSDNTKKSSFTLMGTMDSDGFWKARVAVDQDADLDKAIAASRDNWTAIFVRSVRRYRTNGWRLTLPMEKKYNAALKKYGVAGYITDKVQLTAFPWLWNRLVNNKGLPDEIEVWHEGACCHCAKRLTVPASVELGMGPDCAEDHGKLVEWKTLDTLLGRDLEAYANRLADRKASASAVA